MFRTFMNSQRNRPDLAPLFSHDISSDKCDRCDLTTVMVIKCGPVALVRAIHTDNVMFSPTITYNFSANKSSTFPEASLDSVCGISGSADARHGYVVGRRNNERRLSLSEQSQGDARSCRLCARGRGAGPMVGRVERRPVVRRFMRRSREIPRRRPRDGRRTFPPTGLGRRRRRRTSSQRWWCATTTDHPLLRRTDDAPDSTISRSQARAAAASFRRSVGADSGEDEDLGSRPSRAARRGSFRYDTALWNEHDDDADVWPCELAVEKLCRVRSMPPSPPPCGLSNDDRVRKSNGFDN